MSAVESANIKYGSKKKEKERTNEEIESELLLPVIKCSTAKDCRKLPELKILFPYRKNASQ